jgi:hypothetical protein
MTRGQCFFRLLTIMSWNFLTFEIGSVRSANWAQINGKPYMDINSVQLTGWEERWAHSACNFQQQRPVPCEYVEGVDDYIESLIDSGSTVAATSDDQLILVIGGDTYRHSDGYGYYMNDVWSAPGVKWATFTSTIEKDKWGRPRPRRRSKVVWKLESQLKEPPPGVDYYTWIACAAAHVNYPGVQCDKSLFKIVDEIEYWHEDMKCECDPQKDPYPGRMFSPRRAHSSIAYRRKAYIMGGRARNIMDIPYDEAVGGIPTDNHILQVKNKSLRVRYREKTVLMNDIWETSNGKDWFITTPGCREVVLQASYTQDNGHERSTCSSNSDCYGNEKCINDACICQMWSPREQFAVDVFPPQPTFTTQCPETGPPARMYVFGGFGSRYVQKCAENACNLDYREFYNDVWRSKKECVKREREADPTGCRKEDSLVGEEWEMVTAIAPWRGRGGHQTVVHQHKIFLLGGQGGNINDPYDAPLLNDVWESADGINWINTMVEAEWSPRKNFNAAVVLSMKKKRYGPSRGKKEANNYEYIYVFGGNDGENNLDDCYESLNGTAWLRDYSPPGTYLDGTPHDGTASMNYVRPSSDVSLLGMMSEIELQLIRDEGIATIDDLASADRTIIMKLRGGAYEPDPLDGPNQYRGGDFRFICPIKKRAEAIVGNCKAPNERIDGINDPCSSCAGSFEWDITTGLDLYPSVEYGGGTWEKLIKDAANPENIDEDGCNPPEWRDEYDPVTGDFLPRDEEDLLEEEMEVKLNEKIGGYQCIDNTTNGVTTTTCAQGKVNLTCINLWSPRDFAASVVVGGNMYILGGRIEESLFENDVWYRDGSSPQTQIVTRPKPPMEVPGSDLLEFQADEADCIYEYRVFDAENESSFTWKLKRNWTYSLQRLSLHEFLPEWDPPSGNRRLEVRGVDPAGNVDMHLKEEVNTWFDRYDSPKPWGLIITGIIGIVAFIIGGFVEIRRRQRKKAMERYAIKRMRRKFKGAQRAAGRTRGKDENSGNKAGAGAKDENIDWKKYYNENKKK